MYLDTDIILALVKKEDWLKPFVELKKVSEPKTSTLAVLEATLVVEREYGRKDSSKIFDSIKKLDIDIIDLTEVVMGKSSKLLEKYPDINIFDSVHAAFSSILHEKILSTDNIFDKLEEIKRLDPRELK